MSYYTTPLDVATSRLGNQTFYLFQKYQAKEGPKKEKICEVCYAILIKNADRSIETLEFSASHLRSQKVRELKSLRFAEVLFLNEIPDYS